MIKVMVTKVCNDIREIRISGHAYSAEKGHDLICAGVSSIGVGLLNAIDQMCKDETNLVCQNNMIKIIVLQNSTKLQNVLCTGLFQLKTMAERYPENIIITEV